MPVIAAKNAKVTIVCRALAAASGVPFLGDR
jgi:hypothetical protein